MGRQKVENLHRDLFKEREGKRGKEQEQRSEQQVSEDRWGDRVRRTYTGIDIRKTLSRQKGDREQRSYIVISRKRERGGEEKSNSRDLSKGL